MWTTPTAEVQPTAAPRPSGGLSIRLVFHTIRRHLPALLGVLALAGSVGACIWLFLPLPKKTAAVMFYIAPHEPSLLPQSHAGSRMDFNAYKQSQVGLVKLRRTLNEALNDPKLRDLQILRQVEDRLAWLESNVSVDSRGGAEYLRITIEGDQEKELLALVGAVAEAYKQASHDRDDGARRSRLAELQKEHTAAKLELKEYHKKMEDYSRVLGATNETWLAVFASIREQSLRSALQEHANLLDDLQLAQIALDAAKNASRRNAVTAVTGAVWFGTLPQAALHVPVAEVERELLADRRLAEHEAAVAKANDALKLFDKNRVPPTRAFLDAQEVVADAERKRDAYRAEARAAIVERHETLLRERLAQEDSARLTKAQREYDQIKFRVDQLWSKVVDVQKTSAEHNTLRLDMENTKSEMAHKEALADQVAREIERLRLESKAPHRVTQVEEPFVVTGIEGNRRLKYALLASAATFCLGFAALVFWEYRSRRVTHADEVSTELGTRLIGTIPPLAPAGEPSDPAHADLIQAIDTTRIMLMHGSPLDGDARVLLVTSAVAGEGKTTFAGNLAISLTRAGFRTLLIDGDTHAPTAHDLFDLADAPGLGELLRRDADPAEAIRTSPIPGLSILPAGNWTPATHQMLVGDRWRQLMRELKDQFDFVVIDTSPLLLVADTILLAREADGVVLSVLLGVSQVSRVSETVNRLRTVGARLTGVVVNNVRSAAASQASAYRAKYAQHATTLLPDAGPVEETADQPKQG